MSQSKRQNYFNTLPLRLQLEELGKCRFMEPGEFSDGVDYIRGRESSEPTLEDLFRSLYIAAGGDA